MTFQWEERSRYFHNDITVEHAGDRVPLAVLHFWLTEEAKEWMTQELRDNGIHTTRVQVRS